MLAELEARLNRLARRAGLRGAPAGAAVAVLALGGVAVALALWRWWPRGNAAPAAAAGVAVTHAARAAASTGGGSPASATRIGGSASAPATICVYVVGAVHRPGLYVLPAQSRVAAAVEDAGGMRADAASQAVNLAAKLDDGEELVVPTRREAAQGATGGAGGSASGGSASAGGSAGSSVAAKVDINSADATQLDSLPGVGPSTAAKIVADRQANGPYKSADDLGRVPGIGPKKIEQLRTLVTVR